VAGQSISVGIALEGLHLKMPVLTNEITFGAGQCSNPQISGVSRRINNILGRSQTKT
jgi:hypothetical protein